MCTHGTPGASARRSANLLRDAGLRGHKYAIDAMVAERAGATENPWSEDRAGQ